MIKIKTKSAVALFVIFYFSVAMFAQTDWKKYNNNPVLPYGADPTVIFDEGIYKMWFAYGMEDSLGVKVVIGYATSPDGIEWTAYHENPVLDVGEPGTWNARACDTPSVIKDSSGYKLYFTGTVQLGSDSMAIGCAFSDDGTHWSVVPEPILTPGHSTSWDGRWIESPSVIYNNGRYEMWYTGMSKQWQGQVGHATSTDGVEWHKEPKNPVLRTGATGSGESFLAGVCTVIKNSPVYEMYYCGVSAQDMVDNSIDTVNIGYAHSADGLHWIKFAGNPVLTTHSTPYNPKTDDGGPWAPSVLYIENEYKMWYKSNAGIGVATALVTGIDVNHHKVSRFTLHQNYPNPANSETCIRFSLARTAHVCLSIYNINGKLVQILLDEQRGRGVHTVHWQSENVSSGVYYYRLKVAGFTKTKKLIVVL